MKLQNEHLELLWSITEHGGLSQGARAMNKSQPSASRTISLLEKRIGAPLFEPGRRPLSPTDLGKALARIGGRMHALNREASLLVKRHSSGEAGLIRLGGTPIFMDGVVASFIADFQRTRTDIRIDQFYDYHEALVTQLDNATLDLALLPMRRGAVPETMLFDPVLPGRNVVACRVGHPLCRKPDVSAADLAFYPWIAPPAGSPLARDLTQMLRGFGSANLRINFSGGTFSSILSVLTGSDALTLLPHSVVFTAGGGGLLADLPVEVPHPTRKLGIMRRKDVPLDGAIGQLHDFLTARFASLSMQMSKRNRLQDDAG
ncbi:transcriptional regulator LysR family [Oceaniovalibus guishaninsula JLT2003]|uniref:Transcriptional regulator LysR family n=1 Tax=Oceaniovalibus guishaninsula JLT2003 TaxID=1231392 RepID=K2I9P5_9RHOB|nr:LysR family transcriptional regulator [Oceaniovalibus guishaninsula]EKE45660.1 transcriptional regulator LysR family [Oceaniovalibus guishaninsula JLT2003]